MEDFRYRIYENVYDSIISKKKNIEFRLLNEKSEKISKDNIIKFIVIDNDNKYINVKVVDKYIYDDIDDLYNHKEVLSNVLNYEKEELKKIFYEIFGKEQVQNSKIVGIKFELIDYK